GERQPADGRPILHTPGWRSHNTRCKHRPPVLQGRGRQSRDRGDPTAGPTARGRRNPAILKRSQGPQSRHQP
ncbi:hypothetical protein KEJ17_07475, partial [Candidatus Bathyarchaeota archaeon]|nr:hypothetical protein [Candidatus Bathyarchaeota archaeon]